MLVATSGCLLGQKIRYDGSSKNNHFILKELAEFCEFESLCPEHLAFGTPRPTIQVDLGPDKSNPVYRLVVNKSGEDVTDPLQLAIKAEIERLKKLPLSGIILKAKSPTCGYTSARYYRNGAMVDKGHGLFAQACVEAFPYLPIEEEARLNDAWLRENFIMQLFAYQAMADLVDTFETFGQLVDFHTDYKYLLQSKNESAYRQLGRLVANQESRPQDEVLSDYQMLFCQTIAHKSSIKKTINVLQHMLGFFKDELHSEDKAHILELIEQYRARTIPLVTITELLKLFARKYDKTFLLRQRFLSPYPESLALRSSVLAGK